MQGIEAARPDIDCGAGERRDRTFGARPIVLRKHDLRTARGSARRNAQDAAEGVRVTGRVTADARIPPVGDVHRSVGADRDVARAEPTRLVLTALVELRFAALAGR